MLMNLSARKIFESFEIEAAKLYCIPLEIFKYKPKFSRKMRKKLKKETEYIRTKLLEQYFNEYKELIK